VNVAKTRRQIRLINTAVEHRHVMASLDEGSDDVAADEPRAAQDNDPHAVIISFTSG
jgi:hypothetical protein